MSNLTPEIKKKLIESIEEFVSTECSNIDERIASEEASAEYYYDGHDKTYRGDEAMYFAECLQKASDWYDNFLELLKTSVKNSSTTLEVFEKLTDFANQTSQEKGKEYEYHNYISFNKFIDAWCKVTEISSVQEFQKLVQFDSLISTGDYLLADNEWLNKLLENTKVGTDILNYIWSSLEKISDDEARGLAKNSTLLDSFLNTNLASFQTLVDKFKNIKSRASREHTGLWGLLYDGKEWLEAQIKNNTLTAEDLKYLLDKLDTWAELEAFSKLSLIWEYAIQQNITNKELFIKLLDQFTEIKNFNGDSQFGVLLQNEQIVNHLIKNNLLTTDDLMHVIDKIDTNDREDYSKLESLCASPLIKLVLKNFMLDKNLVDKFNNYAKNASWSAQYRHREIKKSEIQTVFDYIRVYNENNEEILNLNELNEKVYLLNSFNLNLEQKLELSEALRNKEQAKNRLIQLIDNHLEDQYDFETLKELLTKDDKKKKIKMNL